MSDFHKLEVKQVFDAKIRNLTNQIVISANRFVISHNSGNNAFVDEVVEAYSRRVDNLGYEIQDKEVFFTKNCYRRQRDCVCNGF